MMLTDQMDRTVELKNTPKRIISLVPSQTELLYDLGLDSEVIGITKFCVHPEHWLRSKIRVGGTKQLNISKIKELAPDLIIANKEENVREQIEELAQSFPVWVSDVNTLEEALSMIRSVGALVNKKEKGTEISAAVQAAFENLHQGSAIFKARTCYLIWKDPYMTVGGDTFINDMLRHAGFPNMYASLARYPEITVDNLKEDCCEILLLSSEPYPFKEKHLVELKDLLPQTTIVLVDGEMFSWYGSRLLQSTAYFRQLHQEIAAIS